MTLNSTINNLGQWANEPFVQNEVIAYMDQMGSPLTLREIYRPLGLPKTAVNRVLTRLHAKGFVSRYKIPVERHQPGRSAGSTSNGAATWQCYLYSFIEGSGA